jgi:hypothetical protein
LITVPLAPVAYLPNSKELRRIRRGELADHAADVLTWVHRDGSDAYNKEHV